MLSEEADSLFTTQNFNQDVEDGSPFTNKVGLSSLRSLVLVLILVVLNDLTEVLKVHRAVVVCSLFIGLFLFIHIVTLDFIFHFGL